MTESIQWPTVTVHPSQHPDRLEDQIARALRSRRLPAKLHYLTPQQARRWLAVHAAYAPSAGAVASTTAAYSRLFQDLAQRLAGRPVQIISLGCGGGQKDALLARALHRAGCSLRYLAVDAGQSLVLIAADAVSNAAPVRMVRRLIADLDELDEWRDFVEQGGESGEVQLFCAFGVTPNADADRLIAWLARQSLAGDHLLVSANLYDPGDPTHCLQAILPQYDNPETRLWLATFFSDLDWPVTSGQFVFHFQEQASPARICATLTIPQATVVSMDATRIEVPRGACFEVFFSNRFRPADLTAMLRRHGCGRSYYLETAISEEAVWHAEQIQSSQSVRGLASKEIDDERRLVWR